MRGAIVVDSNLLLLLVVDLADRGYIAAHKRLTKYTEDDFLLVEAQVGEFQATVLIPQVVVEVANLARLIADPARGKIRLTLKRLVETWAEIPIPGMDAVGRPEFSYLGVTDAALLELCSKQIGGERITLLTADQKLAIRARQVGHDVIDMSDILGTE